jgi:hypothetical protein
MDGTKKMADNYFVNSSESFHLTAGHRIKPQTGPNFSFLFLLFVNKMFPIICLVRVVLDKDKMRLKEMNNHGCGNHQKYKKC